MRRYWFGMAGPFDTRAEAEEFATLSGGVPEDVYSVWASNGQPASRSFAPLNLTFGHVGCFDVAGMLTNAGTDVCSPV